MTDIVKRLRTDQAWNDAGNDPGGLQGDIWGEAANEIERLRANIERLTNNPADYLYWEGRYRDEAADNERLRAALREIADDGIYLRNCASWHDTGKMQTGVQAFARAALENKYERWMNGCIKIRYSTREDGGLRIWSEDLPGLVLSHADVDAVWRDLGPAIQTILNNQKS